MKSALLVIDPINACCSEKCERKGAGITFERIRRMIPKLLKFIKEYKRDGGRVIFVNCVKWDKKHLAKNIKNLYLDPRCTYYSEDKAGFSEEFYCVKPEKGDKLITKNSYDAFTNPSLNKFLRTEGVNTLIVTGVFGDGCVHSTIQGGFSKGYNIVILKDLIETSDVKVRQELQRRFKSYLWPVMFGKTMTSKEFLKELNSK